ncbi:MAG: NAD(P)H-dependent oxidoreductase subunit E [Pseudomonadota bacterium]
MTIQTLEQIITAHAGKADELLVLAEQLMDRYRAIPTSALPLIQQQLGLTATEIQSVLSFYHYPVTDAPIQCRVEVCRALSCHLKSADAVLRHLCGAFGALPDQVTEDGRLLIARVDCLSDCERAPAVHINGEYVAATDLDALVKRIRESLA